MVVTTSFGTSMRLLYIEHRERWPLVSIPLPKLYSIKPPRPTQPGYPWTR